MTRPRLVASLVLAGIAAVSQASSATAGHPITEGSAVEPEARAGGVATISTALYARITYYETADGRICGVRIYIYRDGVLVFRAAPRPPCRYCELAPITFGGRKPIHILQLDGVGEPEVVFDFFTGGAHCCFYSLIYRFLPGRGTYRGAHHNFFNAGYRFGNPNRDRRRDFLSRDDRFAYRFDCYACSRFPPQVWNFNGRKLVDRTRQFPQFARRDSRSELRLYRRLAGRQRVTAPLAAYAADKCLLGNCRAGFRLVKRALHRGHLSRKFGVPYGQRYVRKLRRFLRHTGYL